MLERLPAAHRAEPGATSLSATPEPFGAIYLAMARSSGGCLPDAADADRCLIECSDSGADPVILVSSAMAISPHPHHPGRVSEGHPPPRGEESPIAERWRALESRWQERLPGRLLVVLRPVPVPMVAGTDPWSRLFSGGWVRVPAGFDPSLQILAPEDLVEAVACALRARAGGVFHVAPRGTVALRAALRATGSRPLPNPLAQRPFDRYLRFFWTVSDAKIRQQLGFESQRTSAEAVRDLRAVGPPARASLTARMRPLPDADEFGLDASYISRHGRRLVGFLRSVWWRLESRGHEEIPRTGGALLVGMHRGFMPWDGVMALHDVLRATGRTIRFLIHPGLLRFPFLFNFMAKQGGVPASLENAAWLLDRGELVGVFPEGIRGAFSRYRVAHRIGRAWRDDYVRLALRHQVPIVPFVTAGSAEIFPIFGGIQSRWWRRVAEWPFIPITPTFPLLPIPLPAKWHTRFLPPVEVRGRYGPEAADDRTIVDELDREVRQRIEGALRAMLLRRRNWFTGSVFDSP